MSQMGEATGSESGLHGEVCARLPCPYEGVQCFAVDLVWAKLFLEVYTDE